MQQSLSSVVNSVRFWVDFFEQVGQKDKVFDVIFETLVEMTRSVIRVKDDPETMKRYPFHLLFNSEDAMSYVLRKELKYDESDVERFKNLYLTPFFTFCVYDMYQESRDPMTFIFDESIDSFCNPVKLKTCLIGDGYDVIDLDLCKITFGHLILLWSTYEDEFDLNHFSNRFFQVTEVLNSDHEPFLVCCSFINERRSSTSKRKFDRRRPLQSILGSA